MFAINLYLEDYISEIETHRCGFDLVFCIHGCVCLERRFDSRGKEISVVREIVNDGELSGGGMKKRKTR